MLKHLSCQIQRDPFVLDHLLGVESLAVYTYGYAAPYYIKMVSSEEVCTKEGGLFPNP